MSFSKECVSRCNHCGLEIKQYKPFSDPCPRCDRTFFIDRWVMSDAEMEHRNRDELKSKIAESAAKKSRRQEIANDVKNLLRTGWLGYRIVPENERRSVAKRLIASA